MFSKTVVVRDKKMSFSSYDPYYISEKYRIIANIKAINQELDCHPICRVLTNGKPPASYRHAFPCSAATFEADRRLRGLKGSALDRHRVITPFYGGVRVTSSSRIKAFVLYHIFDAWDTSKLVRSLQKKINVIPLKQPYKYHHELKRLLEETILNRPAELCPDGQPNRDFANYLQALTEVGIDSNFYLRYFLEAPNNLDKLKPGIKALIEFNSSVANWGTRSEMIAVLLLGKKQLDLRSFMMIKA